MDNNGTLFSTIIALGTGMVIIGLLFGAVIIIAGIVIAAWLIFMLLYWGALLRERWKARRQ